jgi:hypothetical protein
MMVCNKSADKRKWSDEVVMVDHQITEFSESKEINTGQGGSDEFTRQEGSHCLSTRLQSFG